MNYFSSYFEVRSFSGKVFAVQVEYNWQQTHPCLPPLSIFTLLVSPWSSFSLMLDLRTICWSVFFYTHQYQFPLGSTLIWSSSHSQMPSASLWCTHTHNSSSMSKVHSDIILGIPVASPVPLPLLNPNWSSPSTSSIFLSVFLLSILATIFGICAMRLFVLGSLHFVAFSLFYKAVILTAVKSLGHSSFIFVVGQLCHSETIISVQFQYFARYIISCSFLIPHLLDSFFHFTS